ncbi:MAG TPA: T9SS type A sorting domain-containing protein [Bacteroidia bacterium]|nr:T9SS type A sorting domain-containing protein [Bacteroidia bacterium]
MYKFIIAVSFSFAFFNASAQYVTIPDAQFAAYLDTAAGISVAMNGNQMDTSNAAVKNLTYINIENLGIKDLTGIQYFTSLGSLDFGNGSPSIDSNKVASLPPLPNTLEYLACGNNQLTSLPSLASGLGILKCYGNKLTSIPTLPAGLNYLDCNGNMLTSLPALPAGLNYLDCSNNQITTIPTLPSMLTDLRCGNNNLTNLPALDDSLNVLEVYNDNLTTIPSLPGVLNVLQCQDNQLTSLPALPGKMGTLDCADNQLTSLPNLPNTLTVLFCTGNQLTSIPSLPAGISEITCSGNQLTTLPALPAGLSLLWCNNNNIYCLPPLPNSLTDSVNFDISANPLTCLPNYIPGMSKAVLALPLCSIGNPNGCSQAEGIVGFVYRDMDSNCSKDSADQNLTNIHMQLYNTSSALLNQTYTAINGVYSFADSAGTFSVAIDTIGMPFLLQCAHPGIDSLVTFTSIDSNVNFSLTCKSGFDVGVQSVMMNGLVFPGMEDSLNVVAGDMSQWYNLNCAKGDSGTVQISISGPVTYIGPAAGALTPTSIAGNMFKYTIADFGAINNRKAFNLILRTDTTATAYDSICISVTVTPFADNNPANNTYHYCTSVVNSHDPNIKTTYPVYVAPGYNNWFTYAIHFQNTGSASAHNIAIVDSLDHNLDVKTFQLISYSHANNVHVINNVLTVNFPDINLPDSIGNQGGSSGFMQYRIKPKVGLPDGTVINNTGYIYFDYNAPVITDTTQNVFTSTPTSVTNIVTVSSAKVFPDPNNGEFTILLNSGQTKCNVVIYNNMGQVVYTSLLHSGNTQVSLTGKATGLYFYRIVTDMGKFVSSGKLVIE